MYRVVGTVVSMEKDDTSEGGDRDDRSRQQ